MHSDDPLWSGLKGLKINDWKNPEGVSREMRIQSQGRGRGGRQTPSLQGGSGSETVGFSGIRGRRVEILGLLRLGSSSS